MNARFPHAASPCATRFLINPLLDTPSLSALLARLCAPVPYVLKQYMLLYRSLFLKITHGDHFDWLLGFSTNPLSADLAEEGPEEEWLYCARCQQKITHAREAITIQGRDSFLFENPMGYSFRIRCFRQAMGWSGVGTMTKEYTWFPGYAWQTIACSQCDNHLGWRYGNDSGDEFYGLIDDRLVRRGMGALGNT